MSHSVGDLQRGLFGTAVDPSRVRESSHFINSRVLKHELATH